MKNFSNELSDRLLNFIASVVVLEKDLCKTFSGRHIYGQMFRSATSSGANYEEARAGESRADFIHKMQIVLKELRETHFWIKLIVVAKLIPSESENLKLIFTESRELGLIFGKAVVTTKRGKC